MIYSGQEINNICEVNSNTIDNYILNVRAMQSCNQITIIYDDSKKKESEGKEKKIAKIAELNKWIPIYYYARIRDAYLIN